MLHLGQKLGWVLDMRSGADWSDMEWPLGVHGGNTGKKWGSCRQQEHCEAESNFGYKETLLQSQGGRPLEQSSKFSEKCRQCERLQKSVWCAAKVKYEN